MALPVRLVLRAQGIQQREGIRVKKIDASAHIGDSGVALIHQLVNAMGFVWHERKIDAGVDGEIELRNPVTGEVANRVLFVQSKARDRRFSGENDRKFHYLCDEADVDYWMSAPVPVLLVCSHPMSAEAWWMHVQGWFADPAHRASGRIDFDKGTQKFDADAAHRLLNLADPHGQAHVPVAEHRTETLTSNLLHVTIPQTIYHAAIDTQDPREVMRRQHELDTDLPVREDFILRADRIYTFRPPQQAAVGLLITGAVEQMDTSAWSDPGDVVRHRWLVQLLNQAFRSDVAPDCVWHGGRKIIYWRPTPDLTAKSIRSVSGRTRQVFTPKCKKAEPEQISYCLHAALEWQFLVVSGKWYCVLVPTHHYTRDGYRDSLFLSEYLAGIKRLDRNPAVYHQTRMWAHYLQGGDNTFDFRDMILTYGHLTTFEADRAIDDKAWLTDPRKLAHQEPVPDDDTGEDDDYEEGLALFEVAR